VPDLNRLPTFAHDDVFHVVVESPRGSAVKLKYEPALGAMSISRPLSLGLSYPYDWGFVPSTRGADGDPLDAVVLWDVGTFPGVVIPSRALGLLKIEQNGEDDARVRNDRIVVQPIEARRECGSSLKALSPRIRAELAEFFLASTMLEGKDARVLGWDGPDAALELIRVSAVRGRSRAR
jgi:inorganic pyrophosphatase